MTLPNIIQLGSFPYPVFGNSIIMQVDITGKVFIGAQTNGSPKGGIYVWMWESGKFTEVLSPGPQAYHAGSFEIFSDGALYLISANEPRTETRAWRVPGWTANTAPVAPGVTAQEYQQFRSQFTAQDVLVHELLRRTEEREAGTNLGPITDRVNKVESDVNSLRDALNGLRDIVSSLPRGLNRDEVWTLAGERFANIWNEMLDYNKRPQLLSVIWNHGLQLLEHAQVYSNRTKKILVPGQKDIARNPPERLKM